MGLVVALRLEISKKVISSQKGEGTWKPGCVLDWSLNLTSEPTTTMDDNDDMQDIDDFDASEFDVDDRTTFV